MLKNLLECLTYFSKSGKKLRFLVKSIPRTEMVEDKVCLLLKVNSNNMNLTKERKILCNFFKYLVFGLKNINEHNDIPSIHSETLYAGEE